MNIHSVFKIIFRYTRKRRMHWFAGLLKPTEEMKVLDVGGTAFNWQFLSTMPHVTVLNVDVLPESLNSSPQFEFVVGDGRALQYPDQAFDIAYSNSVIEHLGNWSGQQAFAREIRRVGKMLWVQTPAKCFLIEPHYLTPCIHWLSKPLRKKLLRNFSVWGWLTRPTPQQVEASVEEIRLLNYAEMRQLFPDCDIYTERFLLWPKAYIAVRQSDVRRPEAAGRMTAAIPGAR